MNRAVQLLPAMLGADGQRSYLLLFQNNPEVRATGGLPGAFAEISTENVKLFVRGRLLESCLTNRFLPCRKRPAASTPTW
ncbi:DUF4012 domain-containing protein [Cryobacterium sp. Hz9]|nr:DUF4012 domain-containing protein [Cryobacterium sp. Hz9]